MLSQSCFMPGILKLFGNLDRIDSRSVCHTPIKAYAMKTMYLACNFQTRNNESKRSAGTGPGGSSRGIPSGGGSASTTSANLDQSSSSTQSEARTESVEAEAIALSEPMVNDTAPIKEMCNYEM